ncbi:MULTISPECIES: O-antigen ligase family protein [Marinobacter]|jgi:O-antigen ligase|uniref:O-antigen ligase family protein n=1 Tax=Marinobacter TaxID=2742 RepID=UPI000FC9BABC|nr:MULTISPECIES: O-antigen ligase family protein [Marinobacter]MCC4282380.1 O-antigen ligase family protein [Marinobacter salarius]MDM8180479.1 O-antigen ligase family protein [Marinobacter salarius]RUT74894.1 polymerase [Marinobacter sp. NP-6]VVT02361.1 Polymerase [Marinobacter salarius]VXC27025.1 Polymerase [Marinobacter salarius]|tara:strand:+ start:2680 stop:4011 length:1332 start_codon:yes stop_codon:yes gene_type:complete
MTLPATRIYGGTAGTGSPKASGSANESKFLVLATCVFIVTWYLQLGGRVGLLGAIRFEFLLGTFLILCAVVRMLNERLSPTPLMKPICFFFSILVLYTLFSYDRSLSWTTFYERVVKFSMLALFFAAFIRTEWALKMAVAAFLLAMLKLGQEGFVGWLSGSMVWQNQGIPRLHGSTGLYFHPNSFSGMAVGCLPFIYYLFPVTNKFQKLALAALLVCCVIIIVFTGSRTGYVATILLGMYFWREKLKVRKFKYLILGVIVSITTYSLLPEEYTERLHSIVTLEEAQGSSSETRIQILKDAVNVFLSKPWGVGVSAFPSVRAEMFGRHQDTHNLYLELLTNMSALGILSFFIFIRTIIRENKNIITRTNSSFVKAIAQAVIAFVYARLFLGLFGMDTYEIYWWFAAGLTIAMYRITKNLQNKAPSAKFKYANRAQEPFHQIQSP